MRKITILCLLLFITVQSWADSFYGKRISIDNGLSQSSVTSITYDNNGSLWIGTRFGLNEYRNGKVRSFLDTYINNVYYDRQGVLWVMTGNGVLQYDKNTDSFSTFYDKAANCMMEKDNILYIGDNHGILGYDRESGAMKRYGDPDVWTDYLNLYEYSDKIVCIDRRNGISTIKDGNVNIINTPELVDKTVMAACKTDSTLVLCILGEGILFIDLDSMSTSRYMPAGKDGLSRDLILSAEVIDGMIWLGTDGNGIMVMDPDSGVTSSFYNSISLNPGTEVPSSVTSIYRDPLNNIWIGGVYFGVTGLKQTSIGSYLPKSTINYIYPSIDGSIYAGSDGAGLFRLNNEHLEQIASTDGMKITSISDYDDRHLILCAYNEGFFLLDRKTGRRKPIIIIDSVTNTRECLYGNSPEICRLKDGRLLIYAVNNYLLDPANGSFKPITDWSDGVGRDLHTILGEGGDLYTYCMNAIFLIDIKGNSLDMIYDARSNGLTINSLVYRDNSLIFGTDKGLYRYSLESHSVERMPTTLFTRVTELCNGNDGTLWIGADNTLFSYSNGTYELMGENMGVAANEFTTSCADINNNVYLGGSSGFLAINGQINSQKPDTGEMSGEFRLHDVTIDGKHIEVRNGEILLPYNFERLGITISISGSDPLEKNIYRYSVEGATNFTLELLDDSVNIPSLKAGKYTVQASYLMSHGRWSNPQTVLKVKVCRPWYSSIAMLVVYVLLFVALLVWYVILLRKRMLKELQQKVRNKDMQFIAKFENYITEHLSENDLNVEEIAESLAMSRASLYAKVKSTYSKGVGEYIEEKRMEKAKSLLSESDFSVAEIAEQIGYSTPRYFCTRFKHATGNSPLAYRKAHHN